MLYVDECRKIFKYWNHELILREFKVQEKGSHFRGFLFLVFGVLSRGSRGFSGRIECNGHHSRGIRFRSVPALHFFPGVNGQYGLGSLDGGKP